MVLLQEGNFEIREWALDVICKHGHEVRIFNIGRGHWVACDKCKTCMFLGSNLISVWRQETETLWRKNAASVENYAVIR